MTSFIQPGSVVARRLCRKGWPYDFSVRLCGEALAKAYLRLIQVLGFGFTAHSLRSLDARRQAQPTCLGFGSHRFAIENRLFNLAVVEISLMKICPKGMASSSGQVGRMMSALVCG